MAFFENWAIEKGTVEGLECPSVSGASSMYLKAPTT